MPPVSRWSSTGSHLVAEASDATALSLSGSSRTRRTAETVAKSARTSVSRVLRASGRWVATSRQRAQF